MPAPIVPAPRTGVTLLGAILTAFVFIAPLVAMGWLLYDPYGWFDGWRINKASGLVLFVGLAVLLAIFYFVAFLIWAVVTTVLEKMGVALERPALRAEGGGMKAEVPAETHGLTPGEAQRALRTGVTLLYAYGDDPVHGWPEADLDRVAYCLNADEVKRERERPLKPGWDGLKQSGVMQLYSLLADGSVTAEQARAFLRRIDAGEPYTELAPPLTPQERADTDAILVWYVQYEDQFGSGGQRDSFTVAICLSEAEAKAELARRGKPLQPGYDGYEVLGPYPLSRVGNAGIVREIRALAAAGRTGCVMIDSSNW